MGDVVVETKDYLKHFGDRVNVGDHTYGMVEVLQWGEDSKLIIGKFCSISSNVVVLLGGEHRRDWITTYPFPALDKKWPEASRIVGHPATKGDVKIGNDVWIGYGATILSGVNIGDGAVIGACAVVARDVPPYTIVAGNPAREIGKRFSEEKIEELLRLRWWDWSNEKVRSNLRVLCSPDFKKLREVADV